MMRDHRAGERAQAELEKQLVELSGLRNATTRDSGFKLWRQTTLTLLQRTWEGDDSRAERFRRVPFSPPSARADREELREWYERGCAEAAALLRDLIDDVAQHGVVRTRFETLEDDAAAALDALPEDSAPMLTLGGEEPPKPATPGQLAARVEEDESQDAAQGHARIRGSGGRRGRECARVVEAAAGRAPADFGPDTCRAGSAGSA